MRRQQIRKWLSGERGVGTKRTKFHEMQRETEAGVAWKELGRERGRAKTFCETKSVEAVGLQSVSTVRQGEGYFYNLSISVKFSEER
jgi:hypothetical protein